MVDHSRCGTKQPSSAGNAGKVRAASSFTPFRLEDTERSIPELFLRQAGKHPDRLAVKTAGYQYTYAALNEAANRVAQAVVAQNAGRPEPVAVMMGHDAPLIAALLGVLKAGGFYVPLDPTYPLARLAWILEDSQAQIIVTDSKNAALAADLADKRCRVLDVEQLDADRPAKDPQLPIAPDNLAFVLYTSGSTGQPKGVMHTHRTVLHTVMRYTNTVCLGPEDRVSLTSSCSYIASMPDIWGVLVNGASMFPYNVKEEGLVELVDLLASEGITIHRSSPTLFRQLTEALTGKEDLSRMRMVKLGGEQVTWRDVELVRRHFSPECVLYIGYGATELNIVRQNFIDRNTPITGSHPPIGYGTEGVEVVLLDENGQPVEGDGIGEIGIRSRYLSPGYWRRPDLTEAAFLPDPDGGDRRIYRTGDLGRMLPDGCLLHMGRKDFQVKVRGYRIETAEVEAALLATGLAEAVAVMGQPGPDGETRLVAYLVPSRSPEPTTSALRRALAEQLPTHMIPAVFVMLKALPLTPSGKVDRRSLVPPSPSRPALDTAYVAPRNPVEERLAALWSDLLHIEQVGVHDDFFELGGNSLLATQLLTRAYGLFGVEVSLRELFATPTIEGMAQTIGDAPVGQDEDGLGALLAALDGMTEEEAERMLAEDNIGKPP